MDRDRQSELMSAYLDGELTPAERAEAERLLDASPELRDELNDFARLSDLLRALPREEAPAELASAIRREAERKSLLGAEASAPRRSWVRDLVVTVSAMAATMLAMLLLPRDVMQQQPSLVAMAPRNAAFETDRAPAEPEPMFAENLHVQDFADDRLERSFGAQPETAPVSSSLALRGAAAVPPPAPSHDAEVADALAAGGHNSYRDAVQIGDVVPYFQNGVGVIQYTVVDLNLGLDKIEVLLDRNGLSVLPESLAEAPQDAAADRKRGTARSRNLDGDQQLMLVYVDAPRETITQVLNEISQEPIFTQAKLQPPVDPPEAGDVKLAETSPKTAVQDLELYGYDAAQVLVNDALVVGQNYTRNRQWSDGEPVADEASRRGPAAKDDRSAGRAAQETTSRAMSRMARNLHDLPAPDGDFPADALVVQNSVSPAFRKQSGATFLQPDPKSGALQNNAVMLEQRSVVQDKRTALADQAEAKAGAEGLGRLGKEQVTEALAEPTVRLLLVLQAPTAGKP